MLRRVNENLTSMLLHFSPPKPDCQNAPAKPVAGSQSQFLLPFAIVVVTAFAIVAPFFFYGIPSGHDLEFHLNSWMEVTAQWKDGVLYPRWAALAHYGFGEARFLFYPPASWTLGGLIGAIFPWKLAAGIYIWIVSLLAGISMFFLARRFLEKSQAIFAAIFYIVSPYAIVLIYWRSAFAELLAAALIPLLALFVLRLHEEGSRLIPALSLIVAAAWLTNVPSAVMINYSLAFLAVAVAFSQQSLKVLLHGAASAALGALFAGFYLLPAFYEQKWISVGQALSEGYRPQDNFLFITTPDISHNQFNHFVSIVAAVEIVAFVVAALFAFRAITSVRKAFSVLAIWGGILGLSMFSITEVFWKYLPELRFMQFPWRWLLCLNVPLAMIAARAWRPWWARILFYVLLLGSIFYWSNKSVPPWWDHADDIADIVSHHTDGSGYDGADEYLPAAADGSQIRQDAPYVSYEGNGQAQIAVSRWSAERKIFTVTTDQSGKLILRLFNYPAWKVTVNGNPVSAANDESTGQMTIPVGAQTSKIDVRFIRTPDRTAGDIISAITTLLLLWMAMRRKKPALTQSLISD